MRVAELQVQSGREALRNVGQGVLLDAVTAYTNVLGQPDAGRGAARQRRVPEGDPGDHRSAGSMPATSRRPIPPRPRPGSTAASSDLNAAEVNLAISQATYAQVIGNPPCPIAAGRDHRPAAAAQPRDAIALRCASIPP